MLLSGGDKTTSAGDFIFRTKDIIGRSGFFLKTQLVTTSDIQLINPQTLSFSDPNNLLKLGYMLEAKITTGAKYTAVGAGFVRAFRILSIGPIFNGTKNVVVDYPCDSAFFNSLCSRRGESHEFPHSVKSPSIPRPGSSFGILYWPDNYMCTSSERGRRGHTRFVKRKRGYHKHQLHHVGNHT